MDVTKEIFFYECGLNFMHWFSVNLSLLTQTKWN